MSAERGAVAEIERLDPRAPLGIGLSRRSLAGALLTILDADKLSPSPPIEALRALKMSGSWLACITSATGSPRCWAGPQTPRAYPHLAEAVLAYGRHGFPIAGSAKDPYLHPNTVTYRLDR